MNEEQQTAYRQLYKQYICRGVPVRNIDELKKLRDAMRWLSIEECQRLQEEVKREIREEIRRK